MMTCREMVIEPSVLSALERAKDLPSVPAVALEVMRLARDEENASTAELARVISLDPALAAKILKIVNSALMGRSCEIATLKRACAQLGFKTVKLWALSFAMVDSLQRPKIDGFDHNEYWKRCVFRAVSAKLFAEQVKPQFAEEAFLTGLLSQIGQLVLATCLPKEYKRVLATAGVDWTSHDAQRAELGYTSDDLGVALLQTWGLPLIIHQSVYASMTPDDPHSDLPQECRILAQITSVANHCETLFTGSQSPKSLVDLYESSRKFFSMSKEKVEELLHDLDKHTVEIAEILNVKMGERIDTMAVLRDAQVQMLRETVVLLRDAIVSERRAAQLEFENSLLMLKAQTDPLTGLPHRNTFQEALDASTMRVAGGFCPARVGLLMVDIDGFKTVNDTYGHQIGDEALRVVAKVLRTFIREDDMPARYGGDEFAVVMLRTTLDGLKGAAERVRSEVAKQVIQSDKGPFSITVSIGGAHTSMFATPISPHELVRAADASLYVAKNRGRNRCDFAMPGQDGFRGLGFVG